MIYINFISDLGLRTWNLDVDGECGMSGVEGEWTNLSKLDLFGETVLREFKQLLQLWLDLNHTNSKESALYNKIIIN